MNIEQKFFLDCLRDHILGRPTPCPDVLPDMGKVFRYANEQSMEGILYIQCRDWLDKGPGMDGFRYAFLRDIFYSVNRSEMLGEIIREFSENDIPLVCMKGTVFREYYHYPESRTMGDMDFIIHPQDRKESDRILCDVLGYKKFIDNHAVWTYYLDHDPYQFQVEVHDHMFYEELANQVDYRSYFDRIWDHCHLATVFGIESDGLFVPDEEFHFLYLMAHSAKHIINNGSGFRAYLDMALMCRACRDMDWKTIGQELERLELLDFTRNCMLLCREWFGLSMPLLEDGWRGPGNDFIEEITGKTFHDGVFGLENEENRTASSAKDLKRSKGTYTSAALKRTVKKLFPPYEDMQLIPWYFFVDGRPWLMPAAWIYRFFYCATRKREHSKDLLMEPFEKKEDVVLRQEYLRRWGL